MRVVETNGERHWIEFTHEEWNEIVKGVGWGFSEGFIEVDFMQTVEELIPDE